MKVLVVSSLLLCLALGLAETDTSQDQSVQQLRDQIVRSKREPAQKKRRKQRKKKNGGKKIKTKSKKLRKNLREKNKKVEKKNTKKSRKRNKNRKWKGRKKNKNSGKKRKRKLRIKSTRNTTTCSDSSKVSNVCLEEAVFVMKYLRNQVRTFGRRFARIEGFNKTISNKLGKKGVFEETAKYLLLALGGNISSAACGETSKRSTTGRAINYALSNYTLLNNCSAAIDGACTLPNKTLSDEDIETFNACESKFKQAIEDADDCRKKYTTDGAAACTCWHKVYEAILNERNDGTCYDDAEDTNTDVKKAKTACMKKFTECRKSEDAAVQLVFDCSSGAVANSTKSA